MKSENDPNEDNDWPLFLLIIISVFCVFYYGMYLQSEIHKDVKFIRNAIEQSQNQILENIESTSTHFKFGLSKNSKVR